MTLATAAMAQTEQIIRFDGGSGDDHAYAITTDAAGAMYVAGTVDAAGQATQFAVVKHSAQGVRQWTAHYQGSPGQIFGAAYSVGLDAAGNIYAAGYIATQINFLTLDIDWLVVSFDPSGHQRWAQVITTPNAGLEQARQLVVGSDGVYVTGVTGIAGSVDWLTIKYSLAGVPLWQQTKAGAANGNDTPLAAKLDSSGNLVVLGSTSNLGVGLANDLSLVKYAPQGAILWSQTFTDSPQSDEFPGDLAIDPAGNVYVTGITIVSTNPELPNVPFTLKYDSSGTRAFLLKSETAGGSSVAVAPDGTIVLTGTFIAEGASAIRSSLSKFTPLGAPVWTVPLVAEGRVAVDFDGTIFLGGSLFNFSGFDYFAAQYNAAGQKNWERIVPAGGRVNGVHLDRDGNFLLTGDADDFPTDMLTVWFPDGFVPPPPAPPVPAAPSRLTLSAERQKLELCWNDNSTNESGFRIERSVDGAGFVEIAQTPANVRTFLDRNLDKRKTYTYRVRAYNSGGDSAYSNTATARPR